MGSADVVSVADNDRRTHQNQQAKRHQQPGSAPAPFHSFNAMPQSVLKMMMLAMCKVQLENLYRPIWVSPMV